MVNVLIQAYETINPPFKMAAENSDWEEVCRLLSFEFDFLPICRILQNKILLICVQISSHHSE